VILPEHIGSLEIDRSGFDGLCLSGDDACEHCWGAVADLSRTEVEQLRDLLNAYLGGGA
jgi:hypothetical protein